MNYKYKVGDKIEFATSIRINNVGYGRSEIWEVMGTGMGLYNIKRENLQWAADQHEIEMYTVLSSSSSTFWKMYDRFEVLGDFASNSGTLITKGSTGIITNIGNFGPSTMTISLDGQFGEYHVPTREMETKCAKIQNNSMMAWMLPTSGYTDKTAGRPITNDLWGIDAKEYKDWSQGKAGGCNHDYEDVPLFTSTYKRCKHCKKEAGA